MEAAETEVRDVSHDEALGAGDSDIDQHGGDDQPRPRPGAQRTPEEIQEAAEAAKQDLEALAPKTGARQWTFGPEGQEHVYVQRQLSIIGKSQWFALVGEILEEAMGGENSLSLNSLLSPPQPGSRGGPGQYALSDFQDADTFVHALGKLLVHAPRFLEDSICIWLGVPDYEWPIVKELLRMSPEIGGMSDEMFEEILATFIDQNYKSIDDFFRARYGRLRARWQARAKEASQSRSSKP